ncbi:MAG TPA: phospholipid carrier-dependent glycosyltransferase, partial [Verrucomicrobiae bacterium]|nr:phospholipid carrier-dependent glycosyltransferase [Verrucomicrobiae bacterium]
MAGPAMGASDRGPSVTWRSFGAARGLLAILALGLAFRLIIAYVLLPGSGFGVDRASFIGWANDLAAHGLNGFYSRASFIDYTPGYLYVLWLLGVVGGWLGGLGDLIKLPAILADVAVAYLVHQLVVELGGSRRAALLGALLFVVNPVTWFDSAVWAQVDSFGLIFLLLGLRELWRDHPERAAILATIAAVIKPQLGILVPILVAVLIKRHLIDRLRDQPGAGQPGDQARPMGRLGRGPIRLVSSGLLALATAAALCAPFGLSIIDLLRQVAKTAGGYPYITVNAYNPWALIEQAGGGLARAGTWLPDIANPTAPGTPVTILGIPAVFVGTGLLLAVIGLVCVVVARRPDRRTILVGLTILAIAFFVVPTRVHERYLFPFFALGAILAATSFRWRLAYLALALANFANLYAVLTTPFYNNPGISDWLGAGDAIRSQAGVTIAALTHLAVGLWALTELRRGAQVRLDAETEADALDDEPIPEPEPEPEPEPRPAWHLSPGPGSLTPMGPVEPAGAAPIGAPPAWSAEGEDRGLLRRLLDRRPRLADRSRGLWGERGGRIDKLDLLIMAVLLVGVLTLRLFRLSDPYEFHFDEVYHARTAMEFLQDWRYGMPHDIYEFTHPHLAKYAMAEGITYLGDNQVTATAQLGGSISAVLVEPRWDDANLPNDRAGDRFYVAGGNEVRIYDLATRDLIATYNVAGAQALALDSADHRIFIGTANGVIATIDTTEALDPLRTSSPPPAPNGTIPATLANLGVGIAELWVSADGTAMVAGTSASDVVAVDPASGVLGGRVHVDGLADFADGGSADGLVVAPSAITDPTAEAKVLAGITGLDAATLENRLHAIANQGGDTQAVVLGTIPATVTDTIGSAISDGRLTGFVVQPLPEVAAAGRAGVTFIAGTTGEKAQLISLGAAATGLADVVGIDTPKLYVAEADRKVAIVSIDETTSGTITAPILLSTFAMPGQVSKVTFDAATKMVHVLGRTPDGASETVYVVEPHANATYADAQLPFTSVSWALDATHDYPSTDREALLVASADGTIASVDVGGDPFAWRFPGVIAGALTALLLYLLARILFKRRSIAVLVGILVAVDGMFFVQSRIAMNDVYAGLFIVAAYTLFAAVWTGWWRWRWAWLVALPVVGVLLGLALASKWVGLYAIAGIGILILGRSALGRILLILGLIGGTVVLGNIALTALPANATTSGPNYIFVIVMVGVTLAAVLHAVLRPVAWTDDETRLAIVGPAGLGILLFLGAIAAGVATKPYTLGSITVQPLEIAAALIVATGVIYVLFRLAGSFGLGPLAPPPEPTDPLSRAEPAAPPPPGWLRLGWGYGIPIAWMVATLLLLP